MTDWGVAHMDVPVPTGSWQCYGWTWPKKVPDWCQAWPGCARGLVRSDWAGKDETILGRSAYAWVRLTRFAWTGNGHARAGLAWLLFAGLVGQVDRQPALCLSYRLALPPGIVLHLVNANLKHPFNVYFPILSNR